MDNVLEWYLNTEINGMPLVFVVGFAMVGIMFLYGIWNLVYLIRRDWNKVKRVLSWLWWNKWL